MLKFIKYTMIFCVISTLIIIPFGNVALAQDQFQTNDMSVEKMVVDFILIRPLGIAATAVGTAMFIVSLPFSALGGNSKKVCRKMIVEPSKFAFKRELGDF